MKAMILAAGLGTRLRPATLRIPKPAIPLVNVPLIGYSIFLLSSAKVRSVVCNTHHLPELMKSTVRKLTTDFDEVSFSDEEGSILGSAGGLKKAETYFTGAQDLLLMNGDEVFFPRNPRLMDELIQKRRATSALATLAVQDHPLVGVQFGGVWIDSAGNVAGFGKSAPNGRSDLRGVHFTGYQALSSEIFQMIPPGRESNIFYDILVSAIARGQRVNTLFDQGAWLETGNGSDFLKATREVLYARAHGRFPDGVATDVRSVLEWGWSAYDPSDFRAVDLGTNQESLTVVSRDAKLSPQTSLRGSVVIGKGFEASGFAELRDSVYVGKLKALAPDDLFNAFVVGESA